MAGILYGIGVGPGDAELLTLKAVRLIGECDVIGIPTRDAKTSKAYQTALAAVPQIQEKPVLGIEIAMSHNREVLERAYEQGSERIIEVLKRDQSVAFLNLGDPAIYGTCIKLCERVRDSGYQAKLISGVPSFCAVAAELGTALGLGREQIHILPGSCAGETLSYPGTKILMKSGGRIADIKQRLLALEEERGCEILAVTDCGMESQKIYTRIDELDEEAGYFTTILIKEKGGHRE